MTLNQSLTHPDWLNNALSLQKFPISKLSPYATGERGSERARRGLEQADTAFKRAIALIVVRLNGIEVNRELERSQRQRTSNGPSLS